MHTPKLLTLFLLSGSLYSFLNADSLTPLPMFVVETRVAHEEDYWRLQHACFAVAL